jgi:hypothetical protein
MMNSGQEANLLESMVLSAIIVAGIPVATAVVSLVVAVLLGIATMLLRTAVLGLEPTIVP